MPAPALIPFVVLAGCSVSVGGSGAGPPPPLDPPTPEPAAPPAPVTATAFTAGAVVALPGLCEPSGATTGAAGEIWLVDDDQDDRVYRWTGEGAPVAQRVSGGGKAPFRDAEAASMDDAGRLWVVGSHSRSATKGKVGKRAVVVRMTPSDGGWTVTDATDHLRPGKDPQELAPFRAAIAGVCGACALPEDTAGREPGRALQIEGAALHGQDGLLLGLRAPTPGDQAVVVEVDREKLLARLPTSAVVRAAWPLELGGAGVRDLVRAHGDPSYLVLSGSRRDSREPPAALYTWTPGEAPARIGRLPEVGIDGAPEALAPTGPRSAWVFYDEGDRLKASAESDGPHHWRLDDDGARAFSCGARPPPTDADAWAHAVHMTW